MTWCLHAIAPLQIAQGHSQEISVRFWLVSIEFVRIFRHFYCIAYGIVLVHLYRTSLIMSPSEAINNNNNNNNNYDNLYGAVTRPYRYKGALQATTLGRP